MKSSVLIVDDEPMVRRVLTKLLVDSGLPAFEARDASEALNTLRKSGGSICVMVTDVRTPGFLDGLELARFAQSSWPWIKVVVMSGFGESARQDLPPNVRFVPKPWELGQMLSSILGAEMDFQAAQKAGGSVHSNAR